MDLSFFRGKKVFLTGHTGFKGSWMCRILLHAGAEVTGYALEPEVVPSLYNICNTKDSMHSITGDIRDLDLLMNAFRNAAPEIVIHMAAQPIVKLSYERPVYTYETNVMGTVNIMECMRHTDCVRSFLNVTTDKVYENKEWAWGYRETDPLDGYDPYSNSKSCSELVTHSYKNSFFSTREISISTARAGNVIGGGDFSPDRIIPDCVRAFSEGRVAIIRNPHSIRPYQHVLEPLFAYLMIVEKQYHAPDYQGYYNVGPNDDDCVTTGQLVSWFSQAWGNGASWETKQVDGPHEANYLKLDCSKLKSVFNWNPHWHIQVALEKVVEWSQAYLQNQDVCGIMDKEIFEYLHD